jgi:hypothetical protein
VLVSPAKLLETSITPAEPALASMTMRPLLTIAPELNAWKSKPPVDLRFHSAPLLTKP